MLWAEQVSGANSFDSSRAIIKCKIGKNRNGPANGIVKFNFEKKIFKFIEIDENEKN
jgi:replicative DNA helicase